MSAAIDPQAVAERFSISRKTVYAALRSGHLRGAKVGASWRILVEDADAWFDSLVVDPQPPPLQRRRPSGGRAGQRGSLRALEAIDGGGTA